MSSKIKEVFALGMPWRTQDPFLFCVHHLDHYPKGEDHLGPAPSFLEGRALGSDFSGRDGFSMYHGSPIPGFPKHPHRGFETISVLQKGVMDHADSMGASARFGAGDTQWMTAGRGVVHSEMFPLLKRNGENPLELFQIWLNLPKENKMVDPYFTMMWSEETRVFETRNDMDALAKVRLIAGTFNGHRAPSPPPDSWAANPEANVHLFLVDLEDQASIRLPLVDATTNRSLYFFEGKTLEIGNESLESGMGAALKGGAYIDLKAQGAAKLLVMGGRPIGDKVVQYGPFVMNSEAEIQQAFQDYRRTEFGGWPWSSNAPVHGKGKKRFEKHKDGRVRQLPFD